MERKYLKDGAVFLFIGLIMAAVQAPIAEYLIPPFLGRDFSTLQLPEQTVLQSSIIEAVLGVLLWIFIAFNVSWEEQLETLKESKVYIAASGGLLLVGVASGLFFSKALWFIIQPLVEGISALAEYAGRLTLSHLIVFIFGNNVRVAVTAGISVAVVPFLGFFFSAVSALLNGLVLGSIDEVTGISFLYLLIGTFPHGVLEIPAFILSIAVGMRVNVFMLKGFFGWVSPKGGISRTEGLVRGLRGAIETVKLFYLIVPLFLVAAIIESIISMWLISSL